MHSFPLPLILLLTSSCLATPLTNTTTNNDTFTLPPGTSNHGDPNLICVPTSWADVAVFFLGNYLAHAATVIGKPGASFLDTIRDGIFALLAPVSGVNRGLNALFNRAIFAETDLRTAARAGALCEVVVGVKNGDDRREARQPKIYLTQSWVSGSIYGRVKLPAGYGLAILPASAEFEDDTKENLPIKLSSSYSVVRILVSIGQLIFASSTLYRSRGDQVQRYGYAAFGLTVTQYALMSLLNLMGTLVCPQYSTLYLVESSIMDEAKALPGVVIEGTVGRLTDGYNNSSERSGYHFPRGPYGSRGEMVWWKNRKQWLRLPIALAPTAISVLIIYALSQFHVGESTVAQRFWILTWLAFGSIIGVAGAEVRGHDITTPRTSRIVLRSCVQFCIGGAAAVGGFIVVGQMMRDYGVCHLIS